MDTKQGLHKEWGSYVGLGATLAGILALSLFVDVATLTSWVERVGVWGPLVFIFLKISTIVAAPLSGGPLYPLVGYLFGFWVGTIYVVLADMIAVSINFYLARRLGRKFVSRFVSSKEGGVLDKVIAHMSTGKGFFQACLTLFSMPELLAYGAGLSRLSFNKFFFVMLPFRLVSSAILVLLGSAFGGEEGGLIKWTPIVIGMLTAGVGGVLFSRAIEKDKSLNI